MTVSAHVGSGILAAYADGSLTEGMSLLVANHLTFCPECRDKVARLEAVGGALLLEAQAGEVPPPRIDAILPRLDAPDADPLPSVDPAVPLPGPLRRRLGDAAGSIRWRFLLPGLSEYRLDGFRNEDVSLMRVRPGVRILAHDHTGEEATLVLCGRMRDRDRVYGCGDVALAGQCDEHRPQIVGSETCVCLVVLSGKRRFTGPVGRALNLFI